VFIVDERRVHFDGFFQALSNVQEYMGETIALAVFVTDYFS
jgi:hypothetical protein